MDVFSITSIEGNWDARTNSQRVELAAAAFQQIEADFIISSGTYKPGTSAISQAPIRKLGARNAEILSNVYGIDSALIIPVWAFPFDYTYTTIEAFGNATAIGWLISGLERRSATGHVDFAPISSGVHCERVHILNVRACEGLAQFNVETSVKRQQPSDLGEADLIASERRKVDQLMEKDGVIATGRWLHGEELWSLDDPYLMRAMMAGMARAVLPGLEEGEADSILRTQSIAQRYAIMQVFCEASIRSRCDSSAIDRIMKRVARRFPQTFDQSAARQVVGHMTNAILLPR